MLASFSSNLPSEALTSKNLLEIKPERFSKITILFKENLITGSQASKGDFYLEAHPLVKTGFVSYCLNSLYNTTLEIQIGVLCNTNPGDFIVNCC